MAWTKEPEAKPEAKPSLVTSLAQDYNVSEEAANQIIKRVTESLQKEK